MKTIKLADCKTFLMDEEWYFDNFNTHPLNHHCLVGKASPGISGKGCKVRITVLNDDELFTIKLTCGDQLKPAKAKRFLWYDIPWQLSYGCNIVEYACGSFRKVHSTQLRNKSLGRGQTIISYITGDFSRQYMLYKSKFTLEDYMKTFPQDVRGEHYEKLGKLERVKELVYDEINEEYFTKRNWEILELQTQLENMEVYDE